LSKAPSQISEEVRVSEINSEIEKMRGPGQQKLKNKAKKNISKFNSIFLQQYHKVAAT
jgi:hypothetical protein